MSLGFIVCKRDLLFLPSDYRGNDISLLGWSGEVMPGRPKYKQAFCLHGPASCSPAWGVLAGTGSALPGRLTGPQLLSLSQRQSVQEEVGIDRCCVLWISLSNNIAHILGLSDSHLYFTVASEEERYDSL